MTLSLVTNLSAMSRHVQKIKTLNGQQRCRGISVVLLVIILTTTLLLCFRSNGNYISVSDPPTEMPTVESINGTDVIWQIPDSPKAVLFIAHGCHGRAANFWDKSPGCPNCVGLPEERRIALDALDRRFAVLTISSIETCWSFGQEKENVRRIINWWVEKHKLEKLPLTALGASSGGYFVSALAVDLRFSSVTLMIAEGVFSAIDVPSEYPPTLFVHMPKDRERMKLIKVYMETLKHKGIPVKEVRCMEFPLTPNLLSDRIQGLSRTTSVKLYELFKKEGFIDENGFMKHDGRATHWKKAISVRKIELEKHELLNHIQEELNLAFGYHEMTSLQSDAIFDWFESHLS